MSRLPLTGKAYYEKSVIASAQETINLYAENNNEDAQSPSPTTYYLTPGLTLFGFANSVGKSRCTYRTSIGTAYTVIGSLVYFVASNGALVLVGGIPDKQSQVIMADNGLAVVLVDGTSGWAIDMVTNAFGPIVDPSFYGADFVVFLDTFFVFNRPDTNQFYISLSMVDYALLTAGTSFDPLDIAAKSGSADPIVSIATAHKELWLIGELTTEIWIGTGAADFYFQLQQGAYIQHGSGAAYSLATLDVINFWLSQDLSGKNIVVKGAGYQVEDISTPYLVNRFNGFADVSDAIGFVYQLDDNAFYVLTFPTANETYVYSVKTGNWHRWAWLNIEDGTLNRHRANCAMFVHGRNMIGDWETGRLYTLSTDVITDNDVPIIRVKTFAHIVEDLDMIVYLAFDADMEVGRQNPDIEIEPMVSLLWSDNRGVSYGNAVDQSMGKGGEFLTVLTWNGLGMARDRIFKLQWSEAVKTALNGGFVKIKKLRA